MAAPPFCVGASKATDSAPSALLIDEIVGALGMVEGIATTVAECDF